MANVPRAGIGAEAGGSRSAAHPAPASSSSAGGLGLGAGIEVEARPELGEFAPDALTGWNALSRALGRRLPADLHQANTLAAATRRRLARH